METIIDYLNNIFKTLPQTKEIKDLKEDLLSSMEDKYNELIKNGKKDNEAIGIVISEFGNIDELIKEFDLEIDNKNKREDKASLKEDEVRGYLKDNKKASKLIGIGVLLCILGVSILISIYQLIDDGIITGLSESAKDMIGLIPLLIFVAIGTGMFIYSVMIMEQYKDIEYSFTLPNHVKRYIKGENDKFNRTFIVAIIISGVSMILSPISLFIALASDKFPINYGVVGLLTVISAALFIFIYFGGIKLGYTRLLKTGSYSKKTNKVISAVTAIVWPLAVIIYFISGLVFNKWHINWIIFAVTGILYGMFVEVYKIINEKKE